MVITNSLGWQYYWTKWSYLSVLNKLPSHHWWDTLLLCMEPFRPTVTKVSCRFAQKTVSEWMELLEGASFPYGPVNNIQQAFSDPQVTRTIHSLAQCCCYVDSRHTQFKSIHFCSQCSDSWQVSIFFSISTFQSRCCITARLCKYLFSVVARNILCLFRSLFCSRCNHLLFKKANNYSSYPAMNACMCTYLHTHIIIIKII